MTIYGTKLEPDTSPYLTTGHGTTDSHLTDDVLYIKATAVDWDQHNSYNLDLNFKASLSKITISCYTEDVFYAPTGWASAAGTFQVLGRENSGNYEVIETFVQPTQTHQAIHELQFDLVFASNTYAFDEYKVVATGASGARCTTTGSDTNVWIGEIDYTSVGSPGYFLEPDTDPFTATTMTPDDDAFDGVTATAVTGNTWDTDYAYAAGVFGDNRLQPTAILACFNTEGGTPTGLETDSQEFKVLGSNDNATWTLLQTFTPSAVEDAAAGSGKIRLTFAPALGTGYRILKVVYTDTDVTCQVTTSGASEDIQCTEIMLVDELTPSDCVHLHYADNVQLEDDSTLYAQDTYHEHYADNVTLAHSSTLAPQNCYHTHVAGNVRLESDSVQINADITLPFIEAESKFGMQADIALPMLTGEGNIWQQNNISADITLPMITAEGNIVQAANISGNITLPLIQVSDSHIQAGNNLSGNITLPMITGEGNISFNNSITANITLPMIIASSSQISTAGDSNIVLKHSRY